MAYLDCNTLRYHGAQPEWWQLEMARERELREARDRQLVLDFEPEQQEEIIYARVA